MDSSTGARARFHSKDDEIVQNTRKVNFENSEHLDVEGLYIEGPRRVEAPLLRAKTVRYEDSHVPRQSDTETVTFHQFHRKTGRYKCVEASRGVEALLLADAISSRRIQSDHMKTVSSLPIQSDNTVRYKDSHIR